MIPVLSIAIGLLLGWAGGGHLRRLGHVSLRWSWLALILFILQGAARGRLPGLVGWASIGAVVWVCCSVALAALLLWELRFPGMYIAATGILLNVLVVLLNGAMPVGMPVDGTRGAAAIDVARRVFYLPIGSQVLLPIFGDVMPLPALGGWTLVSIGDVLLVVGVSIWLVGMMTSYKSEPKSSEPASDVSG